MTLVTLSRASLDELNTLFGTDADVAVDRPFGGRSVSRLLDGLADRAGPQLAARSVLLDRAFRRRVDRFDVAVSTANEFALPLPSVQYVHFPQFNRRHAPSPDAGRVNGVWSRLAGVGDRTLPPDATLLSNSAWTAGVVEAIYGRRPAVLFPPVDPIPSARSWDEREDGVVFVGRLAPDKRPLRAIRIVDGVRDRGHDVHLHVVGSAPRAYRGYVRRLEAAAADRPHVHVERDASRARVERLLATHKYGLNAKPDEHFGMAVAEYVAAGMLAFAPNSGAARRPRRRPRPTLRQRRRRRRVAHGGDSRRRHPDAPTGPVRERPVPPGDSPPRGSGGVSMTARNRRLRPDVVRWPLRNGVTHRCFGRGVAMQGSGTY
ncbi:glycosyltransferase [Haloplanus sp. GCM10025708]|uniref:glycosyltransferase n=1 Tax=Haloplanus sp. GCM10025708 TaxID=3252679 RepID=UPI00361C95AB